MSPESAGSFKARAGAALADPNLKLAIDRTTRTARAKREAAVADWPGFSKARDLGPAHQGSRDPEPRSLPY